MKIDFRIVLIVHTHIKSIPAFNRPMSWTMHLLTTWFIKWIQKWKCLESNEMLRRKNQNNISFSTNSVINLTIYMTFDIHIFWWCQIFFCCFHKFPVLCQPSSFCTFDPLIKLPRNRRGEKDKLNASGKNAVSIIHSLIGPMLQLTECFISLAWRIDNVIVMTNPTVINMVDNGKKWSEFPWLSM